MRHKYATGSLCRGEPRVRPTGQGNHKDCPYEKTSCVVVALRTKQLLSVAFVQHPLLIERCDGCLRPAEVACEHLFIVLAKDWGV